MLLIVVRRGCGRDGEGGRRHGRATGKGLVGAERGCDGDIRQIGSREGMG